MILISIMVFLRQLAKSTKFNYFTILKTKHTGSCQYLGNTTIYEAEIWYAEVVYNGDTNYGIKI